MPEKSFIIRLSATAFIFVYFVTERGNVGKFVAKLNIFKDGKYIEIAALYGSEKETDCRSTKRNLKNAKMKDLLFCNIPVVISEPDKINKKNLIIPMAEPVFIAVPLNRNE